MKFQPLPLMLVFMALSPAVAFSQNQQVTNCRTLASQGNFVGPEEIVVNDLVCKVAKTPPAQQQVVAPQPATPAAGVPNQLPSTQGSRITNARVIEMSKLGLDDDIIIAKIRNGSCDFLVEDSDLVGLKKAGVSPKVIAAMLDASAQIPPRAAVSMNELPSHALAQANVGEPTKNSPSAAGMNLTNAGAGTKEKNDTPKTFVQAAGSNNSCLIVTSAEGHRMRNAIIAGVFTGGIGLATGLIASGGRYEYRDAINVPPADVKMKYKGDELQKLQKQGVHIVVIRKNDKQGESEAIQNGRNACFAPAPAVQPTSGQ